MNLFIFIPLLIIFVIVGLAVYCFIKAFCFFTFFLTIGEEFKTIKDTNYTQISCGTIKIVLKTNKVPVMVSLSLKTDFAFRITIYKYSIIIIYGY